MTLYTLPQLPFAYDAYEPWCSAETMELHHQKHHHAYVVGANRALEALGDVDPDDAARLAGVQQALTFNLSGHVLHSLFWETIGPIREEPEGELLAAIEESFGGVERMTELLTATATGVPGSGWGTLCWDGSGQRLYVSAIQDHHQHHLAAATPLAVIDVWEHAYYLGYRSDRAGWVAKAVEHVAWSGVATRLARARDYATA